MAIESSQSLAEERAALARGASKKVAMLSTSQKNEALLRIAAILDADGASVLEANAQDLAAAAAAGLEKWFVERLTLSPERVADISSDIRDVAELPDPVGETFDSRTLPNGLLVGRRRVPLGVIGCIYESRPNVTVDMAALALKSGNACVLRGGKEAVNSNRVLGAVIHSALEDVGVPTDAVQVITDPDRAHVDDLLKSHDLIDLMIPRGGAGLITHIRDNATMPVVAGGIGVVHVYVDGAADTRMALDIVDNAKTRRYSICNAVDTVLVDATIAQRFLPALAEKWAGRVAIAGDERVRSELAQWPGRDLELREATPEDWDTEHLALKAGVAVVDGLDGALAHIERHGSSHSDAIVTENYPAAMRFLDEVDSAAVYVNASTQFTDGAQFGLGAEVGVSTQKIHARGPLGLRELTSYKWTILGRGQVRPK